MLMTTVDSNKNGVSKDFKNKQITRACYANLNTFVSGGNVCCHL